MRRRSIALLTIVALSLLFFAANASALAEWEVGAKGGVTVANLYGNVTGFVTLPQLTILTDLDDSRSGYSAGLFATVRMTPVFAVQVEALYSQEGASGPTTVVIDGTTFVNADVTLEIDYLEFPALAVVSFPAGVLDVSGFVGFSIGFNTSSKAVVQIAGSERSINIDSLVRGVDFASMLGLGASLGIGGVNIVADGRWSYSLGNVNSGPGREDIRNGVLTFMVGIAIPTGI